MLSKAQRALWPHLAPAKDLGFTLYGGTAIALRLGHRFSVDFDFFTERPLAKDAIYKAMPILKAQVLQEDKNTLVVSVTAEGSEDPVKVSFFGAIEFGRFGDPELTQDGVLRVAAIDDLMATKLKVILDRVERRDYDDLAAMIRAAMDLPRGLAIAAKMFPNLNPMVSLKALSYHDDVPGLSSKARRLLVNAAKEVKDLPTVQRVSPSLAD